MEPVQEYKTFKTHALAVIITFIVSYIIISGSTKAKHSAKYEDFISRQAERDSIIKADSIAISKLQIERDFLIGVQEVISKKLDSTLVSIKKHTNITVTDQDVIEALEWIEKETSH